VLEGGGVEWLSCSGILRTVLRRKQGTRTACSAPFIECYERTEGQARPSVLSELSMVGFLANTSTFRLGSCRLVSSHLGG
jgi:hypothetical protein